MGSLAVLRREQGDFEAARDLLIESSQIWRTLGYGLNLSRDLQELAKVHVKLGEAESAIRAVMEALDSAPASRTAWTEWLGCFAVVYAALRDPLWGAKFWGCALAHTAKDNFEIRTLTRQMTDAVRQRGGDDAAFDRAMAEGGGWSLDDAIELARSLVADRERE